MSDQQKRTDAEREAARLAREAARRQRQGLTGEDPVLGMPPQRRAAPQPQPAAPRPAAPRQPAQPIEPTPAARRAAQLQHPQPAVQQPEGAAQPAPVRPASSVPPPPPINTGGRRGGTPPRLGLTSGSGGAPKRSARAPKQTSTSSRPPRRRRGRFGLAAFVLALLGIVAIVVIWFLVSLFQPFTGSGSGKIDVAIPSDSSTSEVGTLLAKDGVISSSFFFRLRAEMSGDHFSAGDYVLAKGMSYGSVLSVLKKGPQAPPTENVTVIPGKSRYQLNQLLKSQGVKGSYSEETLKSSLLDPTDYGAPKNTPSLEGFLYPDTYQVRKPLSIATLVADQLTQFKKEMAKVNLRYAKSKNLTAYDVLIIASLEDAEAAKTSDLPKVASVIYNRLRLGMDLGLDTTAAYAANNYSGNLTNKQLNSSSAWNTLNHTGLPPTPIDSPDLAAINAAAHPATTNYLYFIVKVCGNGALNFTSNYNQFLGWFRQYSASLEKKGAEKTEFCSSKNG